MGFCTVGCWLPEIQFYEFNHTYYWPVIGALGLIIIFGASMCRLRFVPIVASLSMAAWFYGTVVPPRHGFPRVATANGLLCTLRSPEALDIKDLSGREISEVINVRNIEASTTIGSFIEGNSTPSRRYSLELAREESRDPSFIPLDTGLPKPDWSRSMNLEVVVQKWPAVAACELKIPLSPLPKDSIMSTNGEYDISASHFQYDDTEHGSLIINMGYTRTDKSPTHSSSNQQSNRYRVTGTEYGIVDDQGHRLNVAEMGLPIQIENGGYYAGANALLRVGLVDPEAKWIKIQVFSLEDIAKNRTVFSFDRVP